MSCIEVQNLTKYYKGVKALENVNLRFDEGRIYGLLGRNGAGKSTLLKIISNRIFADSGCALLDGKKLAGNDKALGRIFLMNESNLYPQKMKVKDAFKLTKSFYPDFDHKYAEKLSELFSLDVKKKIRALSTGYGSIFKVIIALSVNTPFVFLDEPVLGLDANHRDLFYKTLIEKYAEKPFCCVISTHIIEEVSNVIEDVMIIEKGKVIKNQSRDSLLEIGYTVSGAASAVDSFGADKNIIGFDSIGGLKTIYISGKLNRSEIPPELEVSAMDLQKLFVKLTSGYGEEEK